MRRAAAILTLAILGCFAQAAELIPCPDCEQLASPRAVMCPHCGCPGDAIRAASANAESQAVMEAQRKAPDFGSSLVWVTSDRGEGVGVCIQSASQLYVVTAQNLLAGAQSLTLVKVTNGESLPYTAIELASDRDLVRLPVISTNLLPLTVSSGSTAGMALIHVASNNTVALVAPNSEIGKLPTGTPFLDLATNVVQILAAANPNGAIDLASVPSWVSVQPLTYRIQTALLLEARKDHNDPAALLKRLTETAWLTPFLTEQAVRVIGEIRREGDSP
ncbi:MAG: zinc ribbon domain-containing protein [Verrucomicrobia bacterium]|nr:zinc ribbon domain-containing protein [Verrucomicrobiota bacterium]